MLHKLAANAIAGIEKKRISCRHLKIGMYVTELDRPWLETPFLVHGFTIKEQNEINQLNEFCSHVYIDITKGHHSGENSGKPLQQVSYKNTKSFSENTETAIPIRDEAKSIISSMYAS